MPRSNSSCYTDVIAVVVISDGRILYTGSSIGQAAASLGKGTCYARSFDRQEAIRLARKQAEAFRNIRMPRAASKEARA